MAKMSHGSCLISRSWMKIAAEVCAAIIFINASPVQCLDKAISNSQSSGTPIQTDLKIRRDSLKPRIDRFAGSMSQLSGVEESLPLGEQEYSSSVIKPALRELEQVQIIDSRKLLNISRRLVNCFGPFFSGIGYLSDDLVEPLLREGSCLQSNSAEECSDRYAYSVTTDITLDSNQCPVVSAFERRFKGCESGNPSTCPLGTNPARIHRVRGYRWGMAQNGIPNRTRISPCRTASSGNGTAELFPPGTSLSCMSYPTVNSPNSTNYYRGLGDWPLAIAPGGQAVVGAESYFVFQHNYLRQQGYIWNYATNSFAMLGDMEAPGYENEAARHCSYTSAANHLTSYANPLKIAGFGTRYPDGQTVPGHLLATNSCRSYGIEASVTSSMITSESRVLPTQNPAVPFSEAVGISADGSKSLVNQYFNEGGPITLELQAKNSLILDNSTLENIPLRTPSTSEYAQAQGEVLVGSSSSMKIAGQTIPGESESGEPFAVAYATEAIIWNSDGSINARLGRLTPGIVARDCTNEELTCPSTESRDMTPSRIVVGTQYYQPTQSASGTAGACEYPNFGTGENYSRFTYRQFEARQAFIWTPNSTGSGGQLRKLADYLNERYVGVGALNSSEELSHWTLCEASGIHEDVKRGILAISGTGVKDGKVQGFVAYITNGSNR